MPTENPTIMDKPYFGLSPSHKSTINDIKPIFGKHHSPNSLARQPTQTVPVRDSERNYFPPGTHINPAAYEYGDATLSRAKVSSQAPSQICRNLDASIRGSSSILSTRQFETSESTPLPFTSLVPQVSILEREISPVAFGLSTSLPQHDVRSTDLTSYYENSMSTSGGNYHMGSSSPSSQPIPNVEDPIQPLDLGGKRKPDYEVLPTQNLDPKKIKSEKSFADLKARDKVINLTKKTRTLELSGFNGSPLTGIFSITPPTVPVPHNMSFESKIMSSALPVVSVPPASAVPYDLSANPLTIQVSPALVTDPNTASFSPASLVTHSALLSQITASNVGSITITPQNSQTSEPVESSNNVVPNSSLAPNNCLESATSESGCNSANDIGEITVTNSENSSPQHASNKQVHKLKNHWLARHSGEDAAHSGDSLPRSRSASPVALSKGTAGYSKSGSGSETPSSPVNNSDIVNSNGQLNSPQNDRGGKKRNKLRKRTEPNEECSTEAVNGRIDVTDRYNYSSESDEEEEKQSPKRKPPRGKGRSTTEKRKDTSHANSGSDSEKDSDSGGSSTKGKDTLNSQTTSSNQGRPGFQKRGRKPRESSGVSIKNDRLKPNPFKRKPVYLLKKTLENFLQDGSCNEVAAKLGKCRECRWNPSSPFKKQTHPFCRFYAFRKLRYTKNGTLATAGFSNPSTDATDEDKNLWLPSKNNLPKCLELEMSKTLITQLGDQFCELIHHEREAIAMNQNSETKTTAAWKRLVPGVRDLCDVCETTLFNFHWACGKCGFVVCISCYQSRHSDSAKPLIDPGLRDPDRDNYQWLFCSNRQAHELDKIMLTQVIAGDSLDELGKYLHQMRNGWNISQHCDSSEAPELGATKKQDQSKTEAKGKLKSGDAGSSSSDDSDAEGGSDSTLRDLLGRFNSSGGENEGEGRKEEDGKTSAGQKSSCGNEGGGGKDGQGGTGGNNSLKHFVRANGSSNYHRQLLPIRVWTLSESQGLYPTLPHSWLCAGRLLRLEDPTNALNVKLFQDMWKRGQPVLVGNVDTRLNKSIWTPESFSQDFCELKSDLVNCISGKTVPNQSIKKFWDGFDNVKKRLLDNEGNPMLLKLKDWPPGEDFAELLPERFRDLMSALPLTDYTDRNGRLNLAARLPSNFVKPDLGPKMYIAYGSGLHLDKGTTNLHLDISDAVNVMVHVGVPKDVDNTDHLEAVREAIKDSDCDTLTIQKVLDKVERAGALWHIYNSRDADKIRDLLNKVAMERGDPLEPNHDPIHDQSWYLDRPLRKRLMEEYDVSGYPIVQCLGDAVFIPAGAPHQVRNLNNCIKIAEDFVSPENVSHCFDLTEEFRRLSDTHQNHEDKLQIKNIIYHAVKDAVSVLMYGHLGEISDGLSKPQ